MTTDIWIVSMYLFTVLGMYLSATVLFGICDKLIRYYHDKPEIMIDDEGKEWLVGYFDFPKK